MAVKSVRKGQRVYTIVSPNTMHHERLYAHVITGKTVMRNTYGYSEPHTLIGFEEFEPDRGYRVWEPLSKLHVA